MTSDLYHKKSHYIDKIESLFGKKEKKKNKVVLFLLEWLVK